MAFSKVVKNKAYFKRFQVKFRRRREGKTDYYQRRKLVIQDKNKYNSPKYRFIVRLTNRTVITQVAYSTIEGDHIIAAAYSSELPKYGIKVGLTNYAACYATGLLCARRVLTKLGLADAYEGKEECDGEMYAVEENEEGARPFRCFLDLGLGYATQGNRIFGVMKGAIDGGLDIPHCEQGKRLVGYEGEGKDGELDTEVLQNWIFGRHIADYMADIEEEDPDFYAEKFSRYIAAGIDSENMEEMYVTAHEKIRESPEHVATTKNVISPQKAWGRRKKISYSQRKDRIRQIKEHVLKNAAANAAPVADMEDEE
jgi:large subunit ribosomal protein L5e